MPLSNIQIDHFNIPLPVVLSDSTHGDISHFALVTVRVTDDDGAEGLGYTYTVGNIGGSAVASLLSDDLRPLLAQCDPRNIEAVWQRKAGDITLAVYESSRAGGCTGGAARVPW